MAKSKPTVVVLDSDPPAFYMKEGLFGFQEWTPDIKKAKIFKSRREAESAPLFPKSRLSYRDAP